MSFMTSGCRSQIPLAAGIRSGMTIGSRLCLINSGYISEMKLNNMIAFSKLSREVMTGGKKKENCFAFVLSKEGGEKMKRGLTVFAVCFFAVFAVAVGQATAVDVYAEGAYTDTDMEVRIYADIDPSEALRSFGVRLVYDPTLLTFNGTDSSKNEAVWYLGDGVINEPYMSPEEVIEGENNAVVVIGGKLDINNTTAKVSGPRVLLGTVWFDREAAGPFSGTLILDLGKPDPYANFVVGPEEVDVLDTGGVAFFPVVDVYERGDANGDGNIDVRDMRGFRQAIGSPENASCWVDCNGDGSIDVRDFRCFRAKMSN